MLVRWLVESEHTLLNMGPVSGVELVRPEAKFWTPLYPKFSPKISIFTYFSSFFRFFLHFSPIFLTPFAFFPFFSSFFPDPFVFSRNLGGIFLPTPLLRYESELKILEIDPPTSYFFRNFVITMYNRRYTLLPTPLFQPSVQSWQHERFSPMMLNHFRPSRPWFGRYKLH